MWGCEDVDQQMWRCEDADQQMWRCEDLDQQMWGCEDVLQRLLFYEEPFPGALGKNEAILREFLQKCKVECRADSLVPMRFAIFRLHLSKLLRLPGKSDTGSYEVLHLSRKIISANLKMWCSKMQPVSGNQRPDLLTALMNMSLVLRLPRKMHLCRSSSNVPRLPSFLEMPQNPYGLLTFDKMHNPVRLPRETTSECTFWLQNVLRATTACNFHLSSGQLAPHPPL